MKKKGIAIILLIAVIVLTILILDGTNKINLSNITKSKKNNSNVVEVFQENVIKDSKIKNLDLTDISLTFVKDVGSTFSVTLTNNTNEVINLESFNIKFKDDNDNTIAVLAAYVGGNVDPKQVNSIKVTAKEDLSKATSVEYSVD